MHMLYAQEKDIERCMKIVESELAKGNVVVDGKTLKEITIDIMNISYSKGGGYSNDIIKSFAETYVEEGFYKKFINA